jgi:hypothetical protein
MSKNKEMFYRFLERFFWLLPLSFYWITASPDAGWVDSPMIAKHVKILELSSWVNCHNLFLILGKLWSWICPFGEPYYKLTLLCGLFAAIAVHYFFKSLYLLTEALWPSLIGALAIMVSHSLWWHSTILEVYTLNAALISLIIFQVIKYDKFKKIESIYLASFFWGLGCLNHVLMGLFVLPFLVCLFWLMIKRTISFKEIAYSVGLFLLAFQLYLFLFVRDFNEALNMRGEFSYNLFWEVLKMQVDSSTGGHFKRFMFPELPTPTLINWRMNYVFLLLMNFPSVMFPLGFYGFFKLARDNSKRLLFVFLSTSLLAQIIWSANYIIWDMFAFAMPVWLMFGFLAGYGLAQIWSSSNLLPRMLKLLLPTIIIGPVLYSIVPKWAKEPGFWQSYMRNFVDVSNYWDTAEYFGNPNKRGYDLTKRLADALFEELPVGAHLIDSDGKGHYPFGLYYQDVLGRRRDIKMISIFTPVFDEQRAASIACNVEKLLASGQAVYISSLSYPERAVVDNLFARLSAPPRNSPYFAGGLDVESLLREFPVYKLKKIVLLPDTGAHIYKIERRSPSEREGIQVTEAGSLKGVAENIAKIEGEDLRLEINSQTGSCVVQGLGSLWSGGGHLLCIDGKIGDSFDYKFEMPKEFEGTLGVRLSASYDFATMQILLDGEQFADGVDLYAPTPTRLKEESRKKVTLKKGKHVLTFKITGKNGSAEARHGFGIDYLIFNRN